MGKKSRLKKEQRMEEQRLKEAPMYQPPPIIAELLEDYFTAETALEEGSNTVLFRGQPVTSDSLFERLQDEVAKQGIDEDEMAVAFTHVSNMPPA